MPSSRANKDNRSMAGKIVDFFKKERKAEDLVEEESIGGKVKKAKNARKSAIDKALYE